MNRLLWSHLMYMMKNPQGHLAMFELYNCPSRDLTLTCLFYYPFNAIVRYTNQNMFYDPTMVVHIFLFLIYLKHITSCAAFITGKKTNNDLLNPTKQQQKKRTLWDSSMYNFCSNHYTHNNNNICYSGIFKCSSLHINTMMGNISAISCKLNSV